MKILTINTQPSGYFVDNVGKTVMIIFIFR